MGITFCHNAISYVFLCTHINIRDKEGRKKNCNWVKNVLRFTARGIWIFINRLVQADFIHEIGQKTQEWVKCIFQSLIIAINQSLKKLKSRGLYQLKEIETIHRLFLAITMYCQASSSQFNESLNLLRCQLAGKLQTLSAVIDDRLEIT